MSTDDLAPTHRLAHDINGQLGALRLDLYSLGEVVGDLTARPDGADPSALAAEAREILEAATAACAQITELVARLPRTKP